MAELLDEVSQIESTTVAVQRTSATVKGGRRFSFGALVVVGDRRGKVGYGYGKSNEVPSAIEKAQKYARKAMVPIPMVGTTLPHQVEGTYRASRVRLIPAAPGTGVVAGQSVRAVLEMAGITDCLTKCFGSTNSINTIKAVFAGLDRLRTSQQVAELRGLTLGATEIETKLEKGKAFVSSMPKVRKPEQRQERPSRGRGGPGGPGRGRGRKPGGGGGGGGGGGRPQAQDGGGAPAPQAAPDSPPPAPAA
ncbi:MAG: 30S ribosomal protein S5 [Phycisphaerales bacterium]